MHDSRTVPQNIASVEPRSRAASAYMLSLECLHPLMNLFAIQSLRLSGGLERGVANRSLARSGLFPIVSLCARDPIQGGKRSRNLIFQRMFTPSF